MPGQASAWFPFPEQQARLRNQGWYEVWNYSSLFVITGHGGEGASPRGELRLRARSDPEWRGPLLAPVSKSAAQRRRCHRRISGRSLSNVEGKPALDVLGRSRSVLTSLFL